MFKHIKHTVQIQWKNTIPEIYKFNFDKVIKILKFNLGNQYNFPINNFPDSIEKLILENNFNHPILNLPAKLKKLVLSNNFNFPINHLNFPSSLKKIYFGSDFSNQIPVLPPDWGFFS
jgi:hypothetical protein